LIRCYREAAETSGFDLALVHREASLLGPAVAERLVLRRRPFVYDFDDAVWLPYRSPTNRYLSYLKFPGKTRSLCRLAAAVICGNDHLADFAREFNSNVHIVPSTVALQEYRPRPPARAAMAGPPVVGWTGSHSSAPYLQVVSGALRRLSQRRPFRFLVIGLDRLEMPGVDVVCRPWQAAREAEDLWDMDVGIMPLPDEPWARGKCAMKAIQYMGVGIPAVVSPVGVNTLVVKEGVNGFLARTEDEWVEVLDRLLGDAELRRRLGEAGRRQVEETLCAEVQAPRVARLFEAAVGSATSRHETA
jgi:glycosyltransferase involved in cell wall biosynthesis